MEAEPWESGSFVSKKFNNSIVLPLTNAQQRIKIEM